MPETIRIRTTPNGSDKYVKVKIDQEFDFIEVLSLKISQEDVYRNFCSDYGVIVGRVIINNGFGLPNAKVSVFIPLDDVDKDDSVIKNLYPYTIVSDKNNDGVRYNLLPKNSGIKNSCFTPIGTFPNKREIIDNPDLEYVYNKYYKFTATTNDSGDFMIFGVPLGTYVIHVDADISDIGIVSQRPYDLISQGTPPKFFDSPTKFKGGNNLDKLTQVKTTNYSVNVQPFWGDTDTCVVGISRADIDMNYTVRPCAIFMGSIFGDQDKHSINKRCRPRKKLGELCEQITNEGTIEMIRETPDGEIERFDVDGGRVIDSDGSWAYQIPMNLDYVVTDEYGNLVASDDPNKGIPTRASVRFRIGMDNTGGEGKLRTRAKYLVPNNPQSSGEVDYNFDYKTKKTSFRNIYWNKIYSIKNFIPRFQRLNINDTRAFTGVKNVDSCAGDKTPFPFNKLNTDFNPLFLIICFIIKIISFLIFTINALLIPLINLIISTLNFVLRIICEITFWIGRILGSFPDWLIDVNECSFCIGNGCCNCTDILPYVPCVVLSCPFDPTDSNRFAPGCGPSTKGFAAAETNGGTINFHPNDSHGTPSLPIPSAAGLDDCVAFTMAKTLNMFEFDFYNDWINGTLYGFLLKYKKKRNKPEKFCEYDCDDYFSQGGTDGNSDGKPDNRCHTNYLLDVGYNSAGNTTSNGDLSQKFYRSTILKEGLIKKVNIYEDGRKSGEEFYYAATKHDAGYKLFATDLICLGSVFDCDWQGLPKIQNQLIPTSYKIPPDTVELDDNNKPETSGQVSIGKIDGLFFDVTCAGLLSNYQQILNIRHICEYGVDLDEVDPEGDLSQPDGVIGSAEINDFGRYFRDVFYGLNKDYPMNTSSFNYSALPYSTDFNINNNKTYPFASNTSYNGIDYLDFRAYQSGSDLSFGQPKNSYFFYFGLMPGRGGVEKLNQRFFTQCYNKIEKEFNILSTIIPATTSTTNGTLTFTVVSDTGPFTYIITGPTNLTGTISIDGSGQPIPVTLSLGVGNYLIQVVDANGNVTTSSISIDGPPALYATAKVTKMVTNANSVDGQITIDSVGGGSGTYTYTLYKSDGVNIVSGPASLTTPYTINNLPAHIDSDGNIPPAYGYILKVSDGSNNIFIKNLLIDGPTAINLTYTTTNVTCWDGSNGSFNVQVSGGKPPYVITTNWPSGYQGPNVLTSNNAIRGQYNVTIVDSFGTTSSAQFNIPSDNVQMGITKSSINDMLQQCDKDNYYIKFYVNQGGYSNIKIEYNVNDEGGNNLVFNPITPHVDYSSPSSLVIVKLSKFIRPTVSKINIKIKSNDNLCSSNIISFSEPSMRLPIDNLSVNVNGINNAKQCDPNIVSFKFNISHLLINPIYTDRAPYTFTYKVNNGASQTESITSHQQLINAVMPSISNSATITYTITDNVGCTHTGTLPVITMPTQTLSASWSYNTSNLPQTKSLNIIGGIPPYTISPIVDSLKSVKQIVTVTDSVGCTFVTTQSV